MSSLSASRVSFLAFTLLGAGLVHCGSTETSTTNAAGDGGTPLPPDAALADGAPGTNAREPKQHRPNSATCADPRPAGTVADGGALHDAGTGALQRCASDAECVTGMNGRCTAQRMIGLVCSYDTCTADSDCTQGTNALCQCRGQASTETNNQCVEGGNCRVDADCAGGKGYCSPSGTGGCGNATYYCHTPIDECVDDSDCSAAGQEPNGLCTYNPTVSKWACENLVCAG